MNKISELMVAFKDKGFILFVFDIIFLVSPGILAIANYNPSLFATADWVKLFLLSVSFTAPLAFVFFLTMSKPYHQEQEDDEMFLNFSLSTIMSGFFAYLFVGFFLFFQATPTIQEGVTMDIIFGIVGCCVIAWENKKAKVDTEKSSK